MSSPPVFRAIEGANDFFDLAARRFDRVFSAAESFFGRYAYERIHTPVFEPTGLFARSLGDATDIVEKEMYTFSPGSESITLRPEGTAGVVRAYLQRNLAASGRLAKLWYGGPMFRRERPQKGRYRQFHQIGVEAIGAADPLLDAEVIAMGMGFYRHLGIGGVGLRLNSLGCPGSDCRPAYRRRLLEAVKPNRERYCRTCRERFDRNALRALDCKSPECRALSEGLPKSHEHLCGACSAHFAAVREALSARGVDAALDASLVRGLDYYTRTVFEYTHGALGAQDAIGAGGRYDGLAAELGGEDTPAVGFALGVERILLALEASPASCRCDAPLMVYGAAAGEAGRKGLSGLLARLREAGVSADMDFEGRSFKAQMRMANRRGAVLCLILGDDEMADGRVTLKDMREGGGQETVDLSDFLSRTMGALTGRSPLAQKP